MNLTITLDDIRAKSPCEGSWTALLRKLGYANGKFDQERRLSLGDLAFHLNAADALWAVQCLDWSDIAVRRTVITGAALPAVKRASKHTKDHRVHDTIATIEKWCGGDDSVDLTAAAAAADAAADADAARWAAAAAADAAADADAARWAAAAAAAADAAAAEREQQRQDIITAFPPVDKTALTA